MDPLALETLTSTLSAADRAAWISAGATAAAAVAAIAAAITAWQSNRTGTSLAAIERNRWHADLTPQFRITAQATHGDRARLLVELVGPHFLAGVDELTISVRDDKDRTPQTPAPPGPTLEQIRDQVWGPYAFTRNADGADRTGRRVSPIALPLGESREFDLGRTLAPGWTGPDGGHWWFQQYDGKPMRLTLHCVVQGHRAWTIPLEVTVDQTPVDTSTPQPAS